MTGPRLVRLVLLAAAVVCVLVGLRLLPAISTPEVLGPRPAVIVNDSAGLVVVVHCSSTCPLSGGTRIAPSQELRAGPPGARWRVEDGFGASLGCVTATAAGQRLLVSQVRPCLAS